MAERRLRYSERKRLAETGSLGDLDEGVSTTLRNAIWLYLHHARARAESDVKTAFDSAVSDALGRHFGVAKLDEVWVTPDTAEFLDTLELVVEEGLIPRRYKKFSSRGHYEAYRAPCLPTIEADLNNLFDRHRCAFQVANGEIRPISSPLLDAEIVGPALLLVVRPGWEQVERSYREAILHQRRSGERHEALTSAAAAVEAALKATGYKGATLGDLARSFRSAPVASGYSPAIAERLSELLEQLMAWRSHSGSAHGKAPGSADPPPKLVALAVHWAGAFIAYLASTASSPAGPDC
jgi:hypothetical protein